MYINSPGGVVTSGLAIYDTMQFIRPPVSTLCTGQAASMGSLLLAAGEKDMRFSLPNSRIMVHQPSGGFQGQATDIMLHAQEILNLKKRLNEIYVKHTGQTYKTIEDALERDKFLTAEDAKAFGLVDKVIDKRPEDPASREGGMIGTQPAQFGVRRQPERSTEAGRLPALRRKVPLSCSFAAWQSRNARADFDRFSPCQFRKSRYCHGVARAGPVSEFLIVGCQHGWL